MTFATWHEPVRLLGMHTGPATDQQRQLASTIGLPLTGTEPAGVAGVMLEEYLQPLIWGGETDSATDRQRDFMVELGSDEADDAFLTKRVASAWIGHYLALRTIGCLRRLELARDDPVINVSAGETQRTDGCTRRLTTWWCRASVPTVWFTSVAATDAAAGPHRLRTPRQGLARKTSHSSVNSTTRASRSAPWYPTDLYSSKPASRPLLS